MAVVTMRRLVIIRGDGEDDPKPPPTPTTKSATKTSLASVASTRTPALPTTSIILSPTTLSTSSIPISTSTSSSTSKIPTIILSSVISSSITPASIAPSSITPSSITSSSSTRLETTNPPLAAAATSTLTSSSTPVAAADSTSSALPITKTPNVANNTLIVFGALGIVAIIVMLIGILVVLKMKKAQGSVDQFGDRESQPRNETPQPAMYATQDQATGPNDTSFNGGGNGITPLNQNTYPAQPSQMGQITATMAPVLNIPREPGGPSMNTDPFADPRPPPGFQNAEYQGPFADRYEVGRNDMYGGSPGGGQGIDPAEERRRLSNQNKTWAALAGPQRA